MRIGRAGVGGFDGAFYFDDFGGGRVEGEMVGFNSDLVWGGGVDFEV